MTLNDVVEDLGVVLGRLAGLKIQLERAEAAAVRLFRRISPYVIPTLEELEDAYQLDAIFNEREQSRRMLAANHHRRQVFNDK